MFCWGHIELIAILCLRVERKTPKTGGLASLDKIQSCSYV